MTVKILVVDDSTTMRKIMAMTFAAEDAQVETVDGVASALQKLDSFDPDLVFADLSMSPDGYELAKLIKAKKPNAAVIALSSQHSAYDAGKGSASGIDDNIVKPFDTQSVIDRVAQVLARPRTSPSESGTMQAAAPAVPRPPMTAPGSSAAIPLASSPRDMKRTMAFGMPLAPVTNPVGPVQGGPAPSAPSTPTMALPAATSLAPAGPAPVVPRPGGTAPSVPAAPSAPAAPAAPTAPTPPAATPTAAAMPVAAPAAVAAPAPAPAMPAAPAPKPTVSVAATVTAAAAGSLAAKLGALGLTKEQIEGVLALSREVVEQVVWEVVPELAETLIKEEIKRLTSS